MCLIFIRSPAGETQTSQVKTINRKSVLGQECSQNSSKPVDLTQTFWGVFYLSANMRECGPQKLCPLLPLQGLDSEKGLQGQEASGLVVTAETWDPSCHLAVTLGSTAVKRHALIKQIAMFCGHNREFQQKSSFWYLKLFLFYEYECFSYIYICICLCISLYICLSTMHMPSAQGGQERASDSMGLVYGKRLWW